LARPALEALGVRAIKPADYLVDGGFTKNQDIEWAHAESITLWCPATHSKHGPGVAQWRCRMASEHGKTFYKQRSRAECPNAWARRMSLSQLLVRGKHKARAVLLWFALAHNMLRAFSLRRATSYAAA
jgi:Transposase DDE domain